MVKEVRDMDDASAREFGEFVAERGHVLFRSAYALTGDRHAAEDLLQNALAKAVLHWRQIDSDAEAYIRRILYRDFISAWRWRIRRPERVAADLPDVGVPGDHAAETVQRLMLYAAIRRLPPRQRAVLVLRYLEDLSEQQVAEVIGCSVGTVGSQLSRALARLRGDPALAVAEPQPVRQRRPRKEAYTL
jgi:RNA polymerase sigma-70 factor (sigma-E family)